MISLSVGSDTEVPGAEEDICVESTTSGVEAPRPLMERDNLGLVLDTFSRDDIFLISFKVSLHFSVRSMDDKTASKSASMPSEETLLVGKEVHERGLLKALNKDLKSVSVKGLLKSMGDTTVLS
mmetsp:Transcript_30206/g.46212  ORF Transcript_30206/g.46212 Transcript_30206/m.46212 type:complete len:124 (-) Transcript_30206:841-1212(-)